MRFTTSIALLGALAASASAVAAADSAIDPAAIGTYPAFLAYQAKVADGSATDDDKAQLATLGKQLKSDGVPMTKVVGTDTQGKTILNMISQGSKAFSSTPGAAVLDSRAVRGDHEAPKPVSASAGTVPNFISLMNQVYGGDDSATTLASFVEAGLALLESGTTIDQLTKILGTEDNGNDALAQILNNYGTEDSEKRDVVSDIVVDVSKLLTPPPAQAAVPQDNVSGFLFYASKFWANPASAGSSDPEGLAKFISLGQALKSQNPDSITKLLGTSKNGLALAKIVNSGAQKRGFRQHKRGGAAMAVEAGSF